MKKFLLILTLITITSCAQTSTTVFSYSGDFKLVLPISRLAGATVFSIDELSIKTAEGHLISGSVISAESEDLKDSFDIFNYPDYILKLKPSEGEYSEIFDRSSEEIDFSYDLSSLEVLDMTDRKIYHLCKEDRCLAYVVKAVVVDHVLTLHSVGLNREEFVSLLKEI